MTKQLPLLVGCLPGISGLTDLPLKPVSGLSSTDTDNCSFIAARAHLIQSTHFTDKTWRPSPTAWHTRLFMASLELPTQPCPVPSHLPLTPTALGCSSPLTDLPFGHAPPSDWILLPTIMSRGAVVREHNALLRGISLTFRRGCFPEAWQSQGALILLL